MTPRKGGEIKGHDTACTEAKTRMKVVSSTKEGLTVTEDDIWLSDYSPSKKEKVFLQVRVHNCKSSAKMVVFTG